MNANDADSLSLVFDLFERVVKEIADTKEISPFVWLCQDRFHHTFIIHWREASMQKLPVISPMELAQKIIRMSQMLPDHFQFGIVSIGIILDVVAKTSNPPAKAPYQMEQLMNMFHEQMPFHSTDNIVIYNQLLSAWARSGVNEAPQKMENVLGTMQNHGFQPNHSTFNIQLRYWGGLGDVDRVENLLQDMQQARLEPDAISLSEVIFAYAKAGKPDIASEFLEKLVRNHPLVDERMHGLVASRMQNILLSYRNMIKYRAHRMIVKKAVASAEKVYHRLRTLVNVPESQNLHVTMMDIYARARLARKCRAIFDAVPRTGATYTVLIKLYGNVDQAPRASAFLEQMLFYDSSVTPSLTPFSTVLGAWVCSQECLFFSFAYAFIHPISLNFFLLLFVDGGGRQLRSSQPDSFERALKIVRLLESDKKCQAANLTATTSIFNALLQTLTKPRPKDLADAGKLALEILDEMERRHAAGYAQVQPDNETFSIVLKILLQQGDLDQSEALMSRMEATGTPSDRMPYHEILKYLSRLCSIPAAERAEKILNHMRQLSKQGNLGLRPITSSYNTVISAFLNTVNNEGYVRAWGIFLQMKEDQVRPDLVTFTALIGTYSATYDDKDLLEKADILLDEMGQYGILADHRHYCSVIEGWIRCDAVQRATAILMRSIDVYLNDRNARELAAPNYVIMDKVVQGWARRGNLSRATELLHSLYELDNEHNLPYGPRLRTFTNVRYKWMNSDLPDRNEQIVKLDSVIAEIQSKNRNKSKTN
jgi:hypothetical protein